jgi:cyclophilin family peptidyl-prolyl cis-trans isomerase
MNRSPGAAIRLSVPAVLGAFLCAFAAPAQDIPGVRALLVAEQAFVLSAGDMTLRLALDVEKEAQLPADLLSGVQLDSKVDDKPGAQIRDPGKGGAATVAAGTHIERKITLPVSRLAPAGGGEMVKVALQWPGLTGGNCVVTVVPDASKIALDDLDLDKTRVLLATNYGNMTLGFYGDKAPGTVKNFIKLAEEHFYDGLKFHRVIRNFMIQCGDPNTRDDAHPEKWGSGGPGYTIKGEVNGTHHARGTLSMANTNGNPDSAGSQFFVCQRDQPHLDSKFTAFGAVEDGAGLETLDAIASVPCTGPNGEMPVSPVILQQAIVLPVLKKK